MATFSEHRALLQLLGKRSICLDNRRVAHNAQVQQVLNKGLACVVEHFDERIGGKLVACVRVGITHKGRLALARLSA